MATQADPRIARFLARFVTFGSVLAVGFGLLVLIGWTFHIHSLKTILPGQVAVKANTAVCFILIGLALWPARKEGQNQSWPRNAVSQALALLVGVVGLLSFLEYWYGWNLGIDQLLFTAGPEDVPGSVGVGLMSPVAALGFCLLGPAVALLDSGARRSHWLVQGLASIVAVASIFGILDFVLDPSTTHTHISPTTALVLFLLSFGLMLSRTEWGLGALLASTSSGGVLARRLLPVTIAFPIVGAWLRWKGEVTGIYSAWAGVAAMAVLVIVLLSGLTVWTAFVIDRSDRQRQQSEQARRTSEERFRLLLDGVRDYAIYMLDPEGRVTSWNAGAENIKGYRAEEILGKHFSCFYTAQNREQGKPDQELREALAKGRFEDQAERVRKGGSVFWANVIISPTWDEAGSLRGYSKVVRDISEPKRAEEKLREASLYTRSLIEASLDPLVTISREGKITDVNEATEKVTGVPRERLIGSDFSDYFTDPEKARSGYKEVFAQGFVQDYPLAIRHTSGRVTDVLYNASIFKNERGEIGGVFAAARDITERKRAEEALLTERQRFSDVLDRLPAYVVLLTPDYHVPFANKFFRERFGESHGKRCYQYLFGRGEPCEVCETYKVLTTNSPQRWKWTGPDGRHYDIYDFPFADTDGSPLILEMGIDITEREQAEEEVRKLNRELEDRVQQRTAQLQESEERVRRKLDSILLPEGDLGNLELTDILDIPAIQSLLDDFCSVVHATLGLVDIHGRVLAVSGWQRICRQFHRVHPETCKNCTESDLNLSAGIAAGEFKIYRCKNNMVDVATPIMVGGQHLGNLYLGQFLFADQPVDYDVFRAQAKQYGFDEKDYLDALDAAPRLSQETVQASVAFLAKFAQMLSQLSYSGIKLARSMTETRRANAELAASVKELEAFTYSVSHDLRAPLRHISGFSKILTEEFGPNLPPDAQHHLQRIEEGTRRMGLLVDDLLNLARVGRRDLSLQVAGLKSVVEEVIGSLQPDFAGRQVEWKIGNLPYVECDTALMKQVFQNLLSNALKFTRPRPQAVIEVGQEEQNGAPVLYVRDNGVGFSMKYADKLFGVFQRLHRTEDFEGTGVGLATVQRIVQKHGGRIWAEAELDKGATFYLTLGKTELNTKAVVVGD